MAAPPPNTVVSPLVTLVVRILTLVSLVIAVIIILTNTATVGIDTKVKFNDFYAYRYMLATGVIGIAYTLLQTAFTVYFMNTGNRFGGDGLALVDFFGDKALSYLLVTGAAAGLGLTVDLKQGGTDSDVEGFLNKANAAASILFIGFIFSAISSIFSSFALPKRS